MKKIGVLAIVLFLAGCGTNSKGPDLATLMQPDYLRTERNLPMTFPQIQMALFKHQAVCGSGPVFRMKDGETSFATIMESDSADRPWNQTVVLDLMWLQPTLRYETRTRVYAYSFYSDASVKRRIDTIFSAISKPGQCDGADSLT